MWNGYQLLEEINQPLSLQNNCAAVLDNHTKAMVETDHGVKLVDIFHKALLSGIVFKLLHISVINFFCHQSFNHLLKQKPSGRQQVKYIFKAYNNLFWLYLCPSTGKF